MAPPLPNSAQICDALETDWLAGAAGFETPHQESCPLCLSLSYVRREIVRRTRSQRVQSQWAMCALQTRDIPHPPIWPSPASI